jgi:hypothetical protein
MLSPVAGDGLQAAATHTRPDTASRNFFDVAGQDELVVRLLGRLTVSHRKSSIVASVFTWKPSFRVEIERLVLVEHPDRRVGETGDYRRSSFVDCR